MDKYNEIGKNRVGKYQFRLSPEEKAAKEARIQKYKDEIQARIDATNAENERRRREKERRMWEEYEAQKKRRDEEFEKMWYERRKAADDTPKEINTELLRKGDSEYYAKVRYRLAPEEQEIYEEGKRWRKNNSKLRYFAREFVKPAITGAVGLADLPSAVYNLGALGVNKLAGTKIPHAPYPSEGVGWAVDKLTGNYSEGFPTSIPGRAIEFAAGMYGGGLAAKGLKHLAPTSKAAEKVAPWLGSTKKTDVAAAAGVGAITQAAEHLGLPPILAASVGIGAGVGLPMALRRNITKDAKAFDLEAFDAAARQNLDLPRITFDKSDKAKGAQAIAENSIFSAGRTEAEFRKAEQSLARAVERVLDETGSVKSTLENRKRSKALYKIAKQSVPPGEKTSMKNSIKAVKRGAEDLEPWPYIGDSSDEMEWFVRDAQHRGINIDNGETTKKVRHLMRTKVSLNKALDELAPSQILIKEVWKNFRDGVARDIARYGEKNPIFLERYKEAEKFHANLAKRVKQYKGLGLDEADMGAQVFDTEHVLRHFAQSKNDPNFVALIGGKENLKKFEDIATAARALPQNKQNVYTKNMKTIAAISGLLGAFAGNGIAQHGGLTGILAAGGAYGALELISRHLLKKGKSLDEIADYARKMTKKFSKNTKKWEVQSKAKIRDKSLSRLSLDGLIKDWKDPYERSRLY